MGPGASPPKSCRDYLALTREAVARGARLIIWPESSTPFFFEEDPPARSRDPAARAGHRRVAALRQRPDRARAASAILQRRVPRRTRRRDRRRLPQDAARAVRRVRALQAAAVLRRAARRGGRGLQRRHRADASAGRRPARSARPSVTRSCSRSWRGAAVAAGSQLLTTITNDAWYGTQLGAVPALRAGGDARHRARALPRPRRQHRHQRHRRSVRPCPGASRTVRDAASWSATSGCWTARARSTVQIGDSSCVGDALHCALMRARPPAVAAQDPRRVAALEPFQIRDVAHG